MKQRVENLIDRISISLLGVTMAYRVDVDQISGSRIFIQVVYSAPCSSTGMEEEWKGRKWYLSEYMTDDEIVKTAWLAFEIAVRHELLEGFKVDSKKLFNPHTSFENLLNVCVTETTRQELLNSNSNDPQFS